MSISTLDASIARKLEPCASLPGARVETLRYLHDNGIKVFAFVSPMFPGITDYKKIVEVASFVDSFMFENINIRPNNKQRIFDFLRENKPELVEMYEQLDGEYWDNLETEIKDYCDNRGVKYEIYFHHGGFKNGKPRKSM